MRLEDKAKFKIKRLERIVFYVWFLLLVSIPFLLKEMGDTVYSTNTLLLIGMLGSVLVGFQIFIALKFLVQSNLGKFLSIFLALIWPCFYFQAIYELSDNKFEVLLLFILPSLFYLPLVYMISTRMNLMNQKNYKGK